MPTSRYWADSYVERRVNADEAIATICSGQRVFIGTGCGEPQELLRALTRRADKISGLEVLRMLTQETTSLAEIADRTKDANLNIRSFYLGATSSEAIREHRRFITPLNMSEVPSLFTTKKLPINVALIQVSPPDDFGWMSLGISVDVTLSAAMTADIVIAQINPKMPRVMGQSFIHINYVDMFVEHEEDLLSVPYSSYSSEEDRLIGQHIARLIEDGSTLQIGLDAASQATLQALSDKEDLGVHSQFLTDDMMLLYARGNITNQKKGFNDGKMVAAMAVGSEDLYEFLNDNPAVDFHPSDYVNDPFNIAQNNRMVSINIAHKIDLTGQMSAEASINTRFAGISGIADFVQGAKRSSEGKSIMMLKSTSVDADGNMVSNIVPYLEDMVVVVPRGDVHYVVTEYGVTNLFGRSLQERVVALISIAHPDFREELFEAAKKRNFLGSERSLGEAVKAVYPVKLEETVIIHGQEILIRPAKPMDERRIQEHYYNLPSSDVMSRFFFQKSSFTRADVEARSQVDYVNALSLVAVSGDYSFGRIIGVGECIRLHNSNLAEVAFSVNEEFQGKGLGKLFLRKLAEAARGTGLEGLMAFTSPSNHGMIRLFQTLPYKVVKRIEDGDVILTCRFDEAA